MRNCRSQEELRETWCNVVSCMGFWNKERTLDKKSENLNNLWKCLVTQSCLTVCSLMDCNPPGSSVHGIFQAGILEWVAIPFSRGSSWSRDLTEASCITGGFFTVCFHFSGNPWKMNQFSSVRSVLSNSLRPRESQHSRPPCPSPTPGVHSDSVHWVSDAIQPSHPLSSPSPPALNPSQHQSLFQWISSSHEVAKVLEFQLSHHSFQWTPRTDLQNGLVGSPCSPRDSQQSSPTPQFKSISSLALSFLHSPTLTSIHDHWKNHSFY